MNTYLFITQPEYEPESSESGKALTWSCSKTTKKDDRLLVYVAGVGVQYEWRAVTSAKPADDWPFMCRTKYIRTLRPPIAIQELRSAFPREEWAPPHLNFRGFRSIRVPDEIADKICTLRHNGVQDNAEILLAEEVTDPRQLLEGSVRQLSVNAYERNPEARRRCIEAHGCVCSVCSFDFGEIYGQIGKGFIHVHHLCFLSDLRVEYIVDPIKDLRPVCPNCHAILHRRNPPYSILEVRRFLRGRVVKGAARNRLSLHRRRG